MFYKHLFLVYLAIVTGLLRVSDEGSVPEIVQYGLYHLPLNGFTASKGSNFYFLFIIKLELLISRALIKINW